MKNLSTIELKDKLIKVTFGGTSDRIDLKEKAQVLAEYVQRAFPECKVLNIVPTDTTAALNSVSGIIQLKYPDGSVKKVFGKIHIESNTKVINSLGAEKEYVNAEVLVAAGWPVLKPTEISKTLDYPLLLYPVLKEPTLFEILEEFYTKRKSKISIKIISNLKKYNEKIGLKEIESLRTDKSNKATNAPVQALFLNRLKVGGRIDQWYAKETMFKLPGLENSISWEELLDARWIINGIPYDISLREIIDQARNNLAFQDEKEEFLILSHGDDHAGNVRLANPPIVFDPAFAGWNPVSLDVKALAHTGFLPLASMYYVPKDLQCNYKRSENALIVETNMQDFEQKVLIKQIIDLRLLPLLKAVKTRGGNIEREKQRMKSAFVCCALLTVNIAKLLEQNDGRGIGLLPMAIMFNELKYFPMLEYMDNEINKLNERKFD